MLYAGREKSQEKSKQPQASASTAKSATSAISSPKSHKGKNLHIHKIEHLLDKIIKNYISLDTFIMSRFLKGNPDLGLKARIQGLHRMAAQQSPP